MALAAADADSSCGGAQAGAGCDGPALRQTGDEPPRCDGLELALLRPADVPNLCELPEQVGGPCCSTTRALSSLWWHRRATTPLQLLPPLPLLRKAQSRRCHSLSLRLRDQLLAFASVSPVRLQQGQLGSLGSTFPCLNALALGGKIGLTGPLLVELSSSCPKLVSLSLDCHFASVSAAYLSAALSGLHNLQVRACRLQKLTVCAG